MAPPCVNYLKAVINLSFVIEGERGECARTVLAVGRSPAFMSRVGMPGCAARACDFTFLTVGQLKMLERLMSGVR